MLLIVAIYVIIYTITINLWFFVKNIPVEGTSMTLEEQIEDLKNQIYFHRYL